jgi:hypothetical protein
MMHLCSISFGAQSFLFLTFFRSFPTSTAYVCCTSPRMQSTGYINCFISLQLSMASTVHTAQPSLHNNGKALPYLKAVISGLSS